MAGDTLFYAGLAGARQDRIDFLEDEHRKLYYRNQSLVQQIQQMDRALQSWQEEMIAAGASANVREEVFRKVTGKGVREYFGPEFNQ